MVGTGECFVFSLGPKKFKIYHWKLGYNNNYFMCSRKDFIAMGGG